ncbi:MAG: DMT family transporter [Planctomycetota bacterium]
MAGEIASLAAALCWAIGLNLFRKDVRLIGARAVNLFKGIVGCTLFGLCLLVSGIPYVDARSVNLFMLSGVIGLALGDSLLFMALGHLGAHRTALLATLGPVLTALGAWLFRGEALGLWAIAGIAFAVGGVAMVVWFRPHGAEPKRADTAGILFGLLAALCQAGGVIVSKEAFVGADVPLLSAVLRLGAATAILAVFALFRRELDGQVRRLFSPRPFRRLFVAAFFGTFCGIWLMQAGISWTDSAVASALHSTTPLFTLPIAIFILKERVTPGAILGSCLAVAGVTILILR